MALWSRAPRPRTTFTPGYRLGGQVAVALGLDPKKVRDITVHLGVGDVSYVTVEQYVTRDQGDEIATILESFDLTARTEVDG